MSNEMEKVFKDETTKDPRKRTRQRASVNTAMVEAITGFQNKNQHPASKVSTTRASSNNEYKATVLIKMKGWIQQFMEHTSRWS